MATTTVILNNAEKAADMQASLVRSSVDMRDEFQKWLENGNARKFSSQVAIECLDKISEYVVSKKISCSIWEISKPSLYKPVYQKVMNTKLLRIMQRDIYKVFTVVGHLYAKFLKEKPWEKLTETPVITAVDEITKDHVFLASSGKKADITIGRLLPDVKADDVIAWLVTQPNVNGTLYLENVMRSYMSALRNAPQKLALDESVNRNIFTCHTVKELDKLWQVFKAAPNYIEVNRTPWHGQLSAGLAAYRRYIKYLEENRQPEKNNPGVVLTSTCPTTKEIAQQPTVGPQHVDFAHPEFCKGCDPVTCIVEGKSFYGKNWRDLLIALTEHLVYKNEGMRKLLMSSTFIPTNKLVTKPCFPIGEHGSFLYPDTRTRKAGLLYSPVIIPTMVWFLSKNYRNEYGIAIPATSWYPVCLKKRNGDEKSHERKRQRRTI